MGILEEADLAGGKVRFLLEIAHRKWKCICPVGNLFTLGDGFYCTVDASGLRKSGK
jgi:hypothetical protein